MTTGVTAEVDPLGSGAQARAHFQAVAPVEAARKSALTAHANARKHPSCAFRWQELDNDLAAVKRQAAVLRNPPQGQPDYKAELALWTEAEKRWSKVEKEGLPPRQVSADPALLMRQRNDAIGLMNSLASRGVILSVADDGGIIVKPASLLTDADKRRLRENKVLLVELLQQEERIT